MREKTINIISMIIILVLGLTIGYFVSKGNKIGNQEMTKKTVNITSDDSINESIQKVFDSVVVVNNYRNGRLVGYGSGFIYKKDQKHGYIMTNNHVVEGATEIKITTTNGEEKEAKVLGTDSYMDIASLSIDVKDVPQVAEIGESTKSKIGDTIFTVGTPISQDYAGTVTKGIISSESRQITVSNNGTSYMMEAIQIDASINPGNSGGPLVNINGEVIGVNSVKLIEKSIEGMGFAIPIEVAMSQISKLEQGEAIERPLIGITTYDMNDSKKGILVGNVTPDSDSAKAGIEKNDIITKFDGEKIKSSAHLKFLLYKHNIGDSVKVTVLREDKEKELTIKLTKKIGD